MFRARGSGSVDLCGPFEKSPYPTVIGTAVADLVASQSEYSLPTVSGMIFASGSEININAPQNPVTE